MVFGKRGGREVMELSLGVEYYGKFVLASEQSEKPVDITHVIIYNGAASFAAHSFHCAVELFRTGHHGIVACHGAEHLRLHCLRCHADG